MYLYDTSDQSAWSYIVIAISYGTYHFIITNWWRQDLIGLKKTIYDIVWTAYILWSQVIYKIIHQYLILMFSLYSQASTVLHFLAT